MVCKFHRPPGKIKPQPTVDRRPLLRGKSVLGPFLRATERQERKQGAVGMKRRSKKLAGGLYTHPDAEIRAGCRSGPYQEMKCQLQLVIGLPGFCCPGDISDLYYFFLFWLEAQVICWVHIPL